MEELLPLWQAEQYDTKKRKHHRKNPTPPYPILNKSTSTAMSDEATLNIDLEKGAHGAEPELLPACEVFFSLCFVVLFDPVLTLLARQPATPYGLRPGNTKCLPIFPCLWLADILLQFPPLVLIRPFVRCLGRTSHDSRWHPSKKGRALLESNVSLEILLFLSAYLADINERGLIDGPTLSTGIGLVNSLQSCLSNLERVVVRLSPLLSQRLKRFPKKAVAIRLPRSLGPTNFSCSWFVLAFALPRGYAERHVTES
jgi:hypothetical protein